jgi:HAE1 family hydrophobic/amphiphilic exporter-1
MNLTRQSLKSPASVLVLLTLVFLFGIISVFKLPIQLTPEIEQPQITIMSGWREAAPEEIESVIIEPLENAVKNTPGALEVTTMINRGRGFINLTFDVTADMQQAMLDVLTALNQAPPLPLDAMEPIVTSGAGGGAGAGGAALASMLVVPTGDFPGLDMAVYQKVIEDYIEPRFAQIPGVSFVNLATERPKELRITFDPHKAASLGISVNQLTQTLTSARDVSAGVADVGRRQYTVRFTGQYDVNSLNQMRIAYSNGRPVYLADVARVEETYTDFNSFSLRNGKPAYYITLTRMNNSNTVAVLDEVNTAIAELNQGVLADHELAIELSYDASVHIRNALELVKSNLGLGVLLALGILYMFLRGWRATLIIGATIPVSLMVSFLALNVFDRTLNVISLAGLAFSVGLVLDAAIIVQENISRLRRGGMDNHKAVVKGAVQVTAALFASTATSVVIFLPILFMAGIEGQLFSDLAMTLSISVVASLISAITIIPIASKYLLKDSKFSDPFAGYWIKLTRLVMKLTDSRKKQVSWISGLLIGSLVITMTLIPRTDFMPRAPTDGFFYSLVVPPGGNLEFMQEEIANRVKERMKPFTKDGDTPMIKDYNFYVFGSNAGGFIYSADPQRVEELMQVAREQIFADLPDTQVFMFRGSMIRISNGGDGRTMSLDITGANMDELISTARLGLAKITEHFPGAMARPNPALDMAQPELRIAPNDRRISQAGMTRRDVARYIQAFTSGMFVSEFFDGNERMNVILRSEAWSDPESLAQLPIVTRDAGIQTLGELTQIERTVGPSQLRRVNGKKTVSLAITPPADMSLDQAQQIINTKILPELKAEKADDVSIFVAGNAKQMNSAIQEMTYNFLLALFILFLLMTALFRSALDSFFVLLVMPMAVAGGVLALATLNLFTFQSLDLLTMIGFIILLGLVVNNAILLVDQTRSAEKLGFSRRDAVEQAVAIRARPVYLSTLTSLFGMLPLVIVPGVGAEIYRGLASVIVGGMAISALFTLILMPSLLQLGKSKFKQKTMNENVTAIETAVNVK